MITDEYLVNLRSAIAVAGFKDYTEHYNTLVSETEFAKLTVEATHRLLVDGGADVSEHVSGTLLMTTWECAWLEVLQQCRILEKPRELGRMEDITGTDRKAVPFVLSEVGCGFD
jgi:hypothetical protein